MARLSLPPVFLLLALLLAAPAAEPARPALTAADYAPRSMRGWTVQVQKDLGAADRLEAALALLDSELDTIARTLPPEAVKELQQVTLWLTRNSSPGAAYHPSRDWLSQHGRVPEMEKGIEIQSIANFLDWKETQPAMILHEMAHAWHHRHFGFNHPAITAAFQKAQASGRYEKVKHHNGRTERHYALTNEKEYFAELTESYFWRNDFFPFDRKELQEFDPEGAAMVREVWGLKPEPPAAR